MNEEQLLEKILSELKEIKSLVEEAKSESNDAYIFASEASERAAKIMKHLGIE